MDTNITFGVVSRTDTEAIDQIHRLLDLEGEEWDASTIEEVARLVESTGRIIRDPNDEVAE